MPASVARWHPRLPPAHKRPSGGILRRGVVVFGEVSRPGGRDFPEYLERADVLGLRALRALRDVEFNLLVLVQRAVAAAGDCRVVGENVGRPVIRGNEAKTLF